MHTLRVLPFLLLWLIFLVSCGTKEDKLASSLPANAQVVMNLNLESLIYKSEYDLLENPTVKRFFNLAKALIADEEAVQLLEDFQQDANALGIALKSECYTFSDGENSGLLLSVTDYERVRKLFTAFKLVSEDDIKKDGSVYSFSPQSGVVIAWTKEKLLVLMSENAPVPEKLPHKLLTQSKKESLAVLDGFKRFSEEKKDISFFVPSLFYGGLVKSILMICPICTEEAWNKMSNIHKEEFENVSYGFFISFETGEILGNVRLFYDSPEQEEKMLSASRHFTDNIDGEFLKYVGESPLLFLIANINGKEIYDFLNEFGIFDYSGREIPDSRPDWKALLYGVDGDVMLAIDTVADKRLLQELKFDYSIFMKTDGNFSSVINNGLKKREYRGLEKLDENQYVYEEFIGRTYFGEVDDVFYVTTREIIQSAVSGRAELFNMYAEQSKGKIFYLYGDIPSVVENFLWINGYPFQYRDAISSAVSLFESYEAYSEEDLTNYVTVTMADKKKNSLASIFKGVEIILSELKLPFIE